MAIMIANAPLARFATALGVAALLIGTAAPVAAAPVASIEPPPPATVVWRGASPYTPAAPAYNQSFDGPRPSSAH